MNVFYYYYYLFYTKVIPDTEPHATVLFTLSFSTSLMVVGIINILGAHLFNYALNKYWMISVAILILLIFVFLLFKKDKREQIIKEKPKFFNSNKLSVLFTILYFLFTVSFMFWEAGYIKSVLK